MSDIFKAFQEHEASIRRIIRRYFPRAEDVEDLTQETFLRGFAASTTMEIREPKAFLFRVARNLALSEVKKKANNATDFLEDSGGAGILSDDGAATAEQEIDGKRKLAALMRAIAQLPPVYRQVMVMRKVEKLRHKQIATRLNVLVSLVEKRVAMAVLLCNGYLRKEGHDPAEFGIRHDLRAPAAAKKVVAIKPAARSARNGKSSGERNFRERSDEK